MGLLGCCGSQPPKSWGISVPDEDLGQFYILMKQLSGGHFGEPLGVQWATSGNGWSF